MLNRFYESNQGQYYKEALSILPTWLCCSEETNLQRIPVTNFWPFIAILILQTLQICCLPFYHKEMSKHLWRNLSCPPSAQKGAMGELQH